MKNPDTEGLSFISKSEKEEGPVTMEQVRQDMDALKVKIKALPREDVREWARLEKECEQGILAAISEGRNEVSNREAKGIEAE